MRRLTKPGNKRSRNIASRKGLKGVLSRGAGAGADLAPVGRLKKFLLKLKARTTTSKVVHADAPVRSRLARLKKPVAGMTSKKTVKAPLAKRATAKTPSKKTAKASPPKPGATKTAAKKSAKAPLAKPGTAKTAAKTVKAPVAKRGTAKTPAKGTKRS